MARVSLSEIANFDELNRLVGYTVSEPYEDYYAPMQISKKKKQNRIDMAKQLDIVFEELLIYMFEMAKDGYSEYADAYVTASDRYREIIGQYVDVDSYLYAHADEVIASVLAVLYRHEDDAYYYSSDRARAIAEEQANEVWNHTEYEDAVKHMRFKTWNTIMDGRERNSHAEVNGETIPIDEPFELQGGMLQYPGDDSMGCSDEELVNCRCSLSFS